MPKPFVPKVATSNHLRAGDVIYYSASGWTRELAQAQVATSPDAAKALLETASQFPLETVDAVLTDVDISSGSPRPIHFREMFRTKGPSNYFHGKQAKNV